MPAPPLRPAAGVVTGGMTCPNLPRAALPLVVLLTLPGCASTPAIETRVSGTLPGERAYTVVDAAKHYGAGEVLPLAAAEACLAMLKSVKINPGVAFVVATFIKALPDVSARAAFVDRARAVNQHSLI